MSFGFLVINICNHGQHYETPRTISQCRYVMLAYTQGECEPLEHLSNNIVRSATDYFSCSPANDILYMRDISHTIPPKGGGTMGGQEK
jgi:hypothetical protein